ncbi:MAG: hypothetical protein VZR73_07340, partial [Acutalibacteraceae bacterium]|nr:hypothetical protein [Acutalibacteraceae bacterium]
SPVGEAFGSVFCLPFRGGGKNRQLKLSIFAGGVSTAQVEKMWKVESGKWNLACGVWSVNAAPEG